MKTPRENKIEFKNRTKSIFSQGLSFLVLIFLLAGATLFSFTDKLEPRSKNSVDSTIDSLNSKPESNLDSLEGDRVSGDTIISKSGLKYIVLEKGDGPVAKKGQVVEVHYTGKVLATGEEFYNSYKRNRPVKFPLGRGYVIEGFDEGVLGMAVGEKRVLIIPPALGSWKEGRGEKIPPESELIFEVQLIAIR